MTCLSSTTRTTTLLALIAAFAPVAAGAASTVHDHRTGPIVRDHRTPHRPSETVPARRARLDCRHGTRQLQQMGYRDIASFDCRGEVYGYTAMKGAALFRASMKARTGTLNVQFVGIAN